MAPAFTPLLERVLPKDVLHVAWCPTMDLIALVMDDHKLHVHRLNWQRLWVVALDDISVTGAWPPSVLYLMACCGF